MLLPTKSRIINKFIGQDPATRVLAWLCWQRPRWPNHFVSQQDSASAQFDLLSHSGLAISFVYQDGFASVTLDWLSHPGLAISFIYQDGFASVTLDWLSHPGLATSFIYQDGFASVTLDLLSHPCDASSVQSHPSVEYVSPGRRRLTDTIPV